MMQKKVDDELAVRLYVQEQLTVREIGRRLGVAHSSVHRALERQGVQVRPRGSTEHLMPVERREQILAAYRAGMSLDEMRRTLRVSDKTVRLLAKEAGEPPRERGGPRRLDHDQIVGLYEQGWPVDAIAVLVGAGERYVWTILADAGYGQQLAPLPEDEELLALYDRLGSVRAVAGELHASAGRVRRALEAAGYVPRRVRSRAGKP
ncbi:hypothetical protein [Nonomuraea sp. NPDC003214]